MYTIPQLVKALSTGYSSAEMEVAITYWLGSQVQITPEEELTSELISTYIKTVDLGNKLQAISDRLSFNNRNVLANLRRFVAWRHVHGACSHVCSGAVLTELGLGKLELYSSHIGEVLTSDPEIAARFKLKPHMYLYSPEKKDALC